MSNYLLSKSPFKTRINDMKFPKTSLNLGSFIAIFSLLSICFANTLHAQHLSELINGATRGAGSLDNNFENFRNFPIGVDSGGVALNAQFVGSNPDIRTAAVQPDGKILIGGSFQIQQRGVRYRDEFGVTVIWRNLARLNSDGTLDVTFMNDSVVALIQLGDYDNTTDSKPLIWGPDGPVYSISVELNEDSYQYVIVGDFLNFSHNNLGFAVPRLRYLVLDALTVDPVGRFAEPRLQLATERAEGNGFDAPVRKLRKISGGGLVAQVVVATAPARLALTLVQAPVGSIVLQTNTGEYYRRIGVGAEEADWFLLAGAFIPATYYAMGDFITVFDNETQPHIVRVTRDGGLSTHVDWTNSPGPNARVNDIASASQTENIIVGEFTTISGAAVGRIAKIDDTGLVDLTFNALPAVGLDANAYGIALEPVLQHVVVVGEFINYNGITANRIVRLDLDGNRDLTFPAANYGNSSGANGVIRAITRQPDGRLLIAGSFTSYNGILRSGIARLEADGSLDESFTPKGDASGVLAFASDFNGGSSSASLFARPIVVGNFSNLYGSGFKGVARLLGGSFPGVWYQPWEINAPQVALAGGSTTLYVVANDNRIGFPGYPVPAMPLIPTQAPSEPLFYQWQFNGSNIPGANQSSLALTEIEYNQAGSYRVLIYNSQYYIYSEPVLLSVINPFIGVIPASGITVQGRIAANTGLNGGLGGSISMTISRLGTATGTLIMAGSGGKLVKAKFAGQFNGSGILQVSIPRKNLAPLILSLEMDITGAPADFTFIDGNSTISDGINSAVITAWNNRWSITNLASDFAGNYNVGLETDAGDLSDAIVLGPITRAKVSQGNGYFSMSISATTGAARIIGVLSDGSKFSGTSVVWGDTPGTLPIWIPIYKNSGSLQGELNINQLAAGNPVTADLGWTKPSGLTKTTDTFGFVDVRLTAWAGSGLYVASDFTASLPPGPGNFTLDFNDGIWTPTNGGLSAPPFSQSFTVVGTSVTADLPNPKSVNISLNQVSGLVTGSFIDPDAMGANRSVSFQSMILTQGGAPLLRGYFVMPNTARYSAFYVGGSVEGY